MISYNVLYLLRRTLLSWCKLLSVNPNQFASWFYMFGEIYLWLHLLIKTQKQTQTYIMPLGRKKKSPVKNKKHQPVAIVSLMLVV